MTVSKQGEQTRELDPYAEIEQLKAIIANYEAREWQTQEILQECQSERALSDQELAICEDDVLRQRNNFIFLLIVLPFIAFIIGWWI